MYSHSVDWNEKAKRLLKSELLKRGIASEQLVVLLERIGVKVHQNLQGYETDTKRSVLMSKIRSKENKAEKKLRSELWNKGIRYRKNYKKLPGSPDIVINKSKLIVFVDGEFWHGYNWTKKRETIKTNRSFWIPKIERNMQRDIEINTTLEQKGFTVLRFWENQIKKDFETCVKTILDYIDEFQTA